VSKAAPVKSVGPENSEQVLQYLAPAPQSLKAGTPISYS
jgi:hypothetical protein